MDFTMNLPCEVALIIDKLRAAGFAAHVVGGAVRDSLLGRELGDFDITTDASPIETKATFSEYKTIDTGIKHGTVSVIINHTPYEITTYRIDGDYKDARHPDSVTFTKNIEDDLCRRDFTVNAMAYSPSDGLIDIFGGVKDAEAGIIRAVGNPFLRFDEDALRILRALRFASVLDFDIDKSTAAAAFDKSPLLRKVSAERIFVELKKLIMGKSSSRILREYSDIFRLILCDIPTADYPLDDELTDVDFFTRFSAIFLLNSDTPKEDAQRALCALKTDNLTRTRVLGALSAYNDVDFSNKRSICHSLMSFGAEATEGALRLGLLMGKFTVDDEKRFFAVMADDPIYSVANLNIDGRDLMSIGYSGKAVGERLNELLIAVIDGKCENTLDSMIAYLSR